MGQRKKFILLVHERLYGGGSRQTFYILQKLVELGHEAVLVSNGHTSWLGKTIAETGLPVKTYYTDLIRRPLVPWIELALFFYLIWIFIKERPTVILPAGVKLIGLSAIAGWLCCVPNRVAIIRGQGAPPSSRRMKIVYAMEKLMARLGTRFITVCEFNRQEFIQLGICKPQHVKTVHNGTDPGLFARKALEPGVFRKKMNIAPEAFVIGMAGRLCPQKRYDVFIAMMAQLCAQYPHVEGFIIGDGDDKEHLQHLIDATGFSHRIRQTGYIADMKPVYRDLDLSVLFTQYEGLPNVLVESSAAGLPMIADRVCGNVEVVRHGINGFVVEPAQHPKDVAEATYYARQLIEDKNLYQLMSDNATALAASDFDRKRLLNNLVETSLQFN